MRKLGKNRIIVDQLIWGSEEKQNHCWSADMRGWGKRESLLIGCYEWVEKQDHCWLIEENELPMLIVVKHMKSWLMKIGSRKQERKRLVDVTLMFISISPLSISSFSPFFLIQSIGHFWDLTIFCHLFQSVDLVWPIFG